MPGHLPYNKLQLWGTRNLRDTLRGEKLPSPGPCTREALNPPTVNPKP